MGNNQRLKRHDTSIHFNLAQGEFIGLAKVSAKILQDLSVAVYEELKDKKLVQSYFEGALQNLVDKGRHIRAIDVSEKKWIEIDFPKDFEAAKLIASHFKRVYIKTHLVHETIFHIYTV